VETNQNLGFFGAYVKGLIELVKWLGPSVVSALVVSLSLSALLEGRKKEK
jgi:hypothetical protein